MEKIVNYDLKEEEFRQLQPYLEKFGYSLNGYMGMNSFTIDDESSVEFEECAIFAIGTHPKNKNFFVNLKVKDSDLVECIDSYFK